MIETMPLVKQDAVADKQGAVAEKEYSVISVDKIESPDGIEGDNWYRYVIKRGESSIVGNRRGTLQQVTSHANDYVEGLNSRTGAKGSSIWAPSRKSGQKK